MLTLETIGKRYDDLWAVRDVSLRLEPGAFLALLGKSGAGKSTLLRMISGVEAPDQGRILLNGKDVTRLPPEHRPVATVWQHLNLFPHLSVLQNVAFGLTVRGYARRESDRRALELLELVGLAGMGNRSPATLSGGEQQRVALVRCLAISPAVLLLDEPFGALDNRLRYELVHLLRMIHRRDNLTVFMVTHRIEEALACATDLAVLDSGKFRHLGSPDAAYFRPVSIDTALLLGDTNILPVVGSKLVGDRCLAETTVGRLVSDRWAAAGTEAPFYSVRPDRIRITVPEVASVSGENRLQGVVEDVLYEGSTTRTYVRSGDYLFEVSSPSTGSPLDTSLIGCERAVCWDAADAFCRI